MTALQYHQEQAAQYEFALLMMRIGCCLHIYDDLVRRVKA